MPLTRAPRLIAVLAMGLLAISLVPGCADRLYERTLVPPTASDAQDCLDRCNLRTDECQGRQNTRVQECQELQAGSQANYDLCLENGASNCVKPDPCAPADMGICQQEYDACFTACGGRVEKHLRPQPWRTPTEAQPEMTVPAEAVPETEGAAMDGPEHAEG